MYARTQLERVQPIRVSRWRIADRANLRRFLFFVPELYPGGEEWLERRMDDFRLGTASCVVIHRADTVLGVIIDAEKGRFSRKICNFYLSPVIRGLGLGSILLDRRIAQWKFDSIEEASITVASARERYIAHLLVSRGFKRAAICPARYGPNRDEVVYQLSLAT
jgi:hypothetical protein